MISQLSQLTGRADRLRRVRAAGPPETRAIICTFNLTETP